MYSGDALREKGFCCSATKVLQHEHVGFDPQPQVHRVGIPSREIVQQKGEESTYQQQ